MENSPRRCLSALCATVVVLLLAAPVCGDGKMIVKKGWDGRVEEFAQDAIIIFHGSDTAGGAVEELILKVGVKGNAETFAWVIPFPSEPKVVKEDAKLFAELYRYVAMRRSARTEKKPGTKSAGGTFGPAREDRPVEVLSRKVVGSYDVAVVRENVPGALNKWLAAEGYETLEAGEDVIGFYRKKNYVFACIKVTGSALAKTGTSDLHPLRFTFKTGGRDGIYFPMKMTGLQFKPFDVNLYVFYRYWLNDHKSPYGFEHRGFALHYRDWDSARCRPNGGKAWSLPQLDPFLRRHAARLPTVAKLFQALHPGDTYYLTNIRARGLKPANVRKWRDDLWLFPYYTDPKMVPFDARKGGVASGAHKH